MWKQQEVKSNKRLKLTAKVMDVRMRIMYQ